MFTTRENLKQWANLSQCFGLSEATKCITFIFCMRVILGWGTMRAPLTMDSAGLHVAMAVQFWWRQPRGPLWRKTCCLMEHREQSRVTLRLCSRNLGDGKANVREPGFGGKFRREMRWPHNKQFGTMNKHQTTDPAGALVLVPAPAYPFGWLGGSPSCPHLGLSFLMSWTSSSLRLFWFFWWMSLWHYIHISSRETAHVEMQTWVHTVCLRLSGCVDEWF